MKLIISELFKFLSFTESGVYERDAEHIACTVTRMGYAYRGTRIGVRVSIVHAELKSVGDAR